MIAKPSDPSQTKPATVKLNYVAWLSWNRKSFKFGATDLLVMNQLIVRCDVDGRFPMLITTLANRTRAAPSTVRRSVTRLADAGFIEVTHRQGRSSLFRVCFEKAKPNWVTYKSERAKRRQEDAAQGAKASARTPPKAGRTPRQDVSYNSISSDHRSSYISKRPSGRGSGNAFAGEEGEDLGLDRLLRRKMSSHPDNYVPEVQHTVGRAGRAAPDGDSEDDPVEQLVALWPKRDANERKLRGAWYNHVTKPAVDPEIVLGAARNWAKYWKFRPDAWVPFLGKWLADRGWRKKPPAVSREDKGMAAYHRMVDAALARKRSGGSD